MSRIGRKPVTVPQGVTLDLQGNQVAVKGPKGELRRQLHPEMHGLGSSVTRANGPVDRSWSRREQRPHVTGVCEDMAEGVTIYSFWLVPLASCKCCRADR